LASKSQEFDFRFQLYDVSRLHALAGVLRTCGKWLKWSQLCLSDRPSATTPSRRRASAKVLRNQILEISIRYHQTSELSFGFGCCAARVVEQDGKSIEEAVIALSRARNLGFRLRTFNFAPMSQFSGLMGISEAETFLCLLRRCVAGVSVAPLGKQHQLIFLCARKELAKRGTRDISTAL